MKTFQECKRASLCRRMCGWAVMFAPFNCSHTARTYDARTCIPLAPFAVSGNRFRSSICQTYGKGTTKMPIELFKNSKSELEIYSPETRCGTNIIPGASVMCIWLRLNALMSVSEFAYNQLTGCRMLCWWHLTCKRQICSTLFFVHSHHYIVQTNK